MHGCHTEWAWASGPPVEMKVAVILSEAKDLQFRGELMQILRFAQNDRRRAQDDRLGL